MANQSKKPSEFMLWRKKTKDEPKLAERSVEVASRAAYQAWCDIKGENPNWGKSGFLAAQLEWKEVSRSVLRAYHEAGYIVVHQAMAKALRELADELEKELKK